jgi:hypothetical protein
VLRHLLLQIVCPHVKLYAAARNQTAFCVTFASLHHRIEDAIKNGTLIIDAFYSILTHLLTFPNPVAPNAPFCGFAPTLVAGTNICSSHSLGFHVQTGPGAHPASCTMGTGSFSGVKRPGRGADHPPPPSAEVENE